MTFVESPLGGNLGATTASFFLLDPTGTVPIEPLPDIVPGITPMRVTLDMVDGEQVTFEYDVTEHAIQGFLDVSSHVRKRLEQLTITGTLGATPPLLPLPAPPVPGGLVRLDLLRVRNLKRIADLRQLVMVVTPRVSLARAFIASVQASWAPDQGESTVVTITVREARIVSPLFAAAVAPDYPAQAPANNVAEGGGQTAPKMVDATVTQSDITGVPPSIASPAGMGALAP